MSDVVDLRGLANRAERLASAFDDRQMRRVTTNVAVAAKRDVDDELAGDVGSDRRMSGWARVRFGSGFKLTSGTTAELEPRPAGAWWVLDRGRRAIAAGQPKRRALKVYRTPWGPRTATRESRFRQGATAGKGTWGDAVKQIERRTPERVNAEVERVLMEAFR